MWIRSLAPLTTYVSAFLVQFAHVGALPAQEIRVVRRVHVALGLDERPLLEPHLAVHPTNGDHLLGAAMVSVAAKSFEDIHRQRSCASFLSLNGGKTWERHDFPITTCYDPWVAVTPDGRAVFTALGTHPALPDQPGGLVVFHSSDGGRTWDKTPVGLGRGHDHQTVVVDAGSPGRKGWLYVVSSQRIRAAEGRRRYSIFVARSRSAGKIFDAPVRILPNNLIVKAETPALLSDGTLIVPFVEAGHERGSIIDRLSWVARSTDGGYTFSMPLFVTAACGPSPFQVFALSALAADTSEGPLQDRLYFACNERGGGAVIVTASDDRGESWTDPVRIHQAPADTAVLRQIRGMAVNKNGVLGIVWTERTGSDRECYEVYFSASVDGGRSFLPERRISQGRSCPAGPANGANAAGWSTGGDYYGLAASPDGQFQVLWVEPRDGPFQLWTAAVEVEAVSSDAG